MTLIFRHLLSSSFFALVLASCGEKKKPVSTKASSLPAATSRENLHFSPSSACLKCHAEAHQAWQKSHHALAHRDTGNDVDALAFSAGKIALGDARWTFSGGGREPGHPLE